VVLDMMHQKIRHLDLELVIVTRITDFMTTIVKYIYQRRNGRPPIEIPCSDTTMFFHDFMNGATPVAPEQLPTVTPDDIAVLQYTGGTTGVSKGAELRHRNLMANIRQLVSWFSPTERTESFLAALPLFHVFGMTVTQNICLAVGGCMVLVPDPRNIQLLLSVIRKKQPTVVSLVPVLVQKLLEHCKEKDLEAARFCLCGGAALSYELLKKFKERTGQLIIEGYGLSECSPVTHCNIARGLSVKHSIGLPIANTEAKIVDEAGQEVPLGGVGELWVRGPQVMQGYWNNPEETAKVMKPEGWLATGDMARMDEDGFFYIVDRKKDMILSTSGFNVYPSEIEKVLLLHPEVREAAVIGVLSEDGCESVKAVVVSSVNEISEHDLVKHCRQYLAPYKVPRHIEFRSELPRTLLGKTLYRVLRKEEAERLLRSTPSGVAR
jgi:long-chain acyl-CoA synthetase